MATSVRQPSRGNLTKNSHYLLIRTGSGQKKSREKHGTWESGKAMRLSCKGISTKSTTFALVTTHAGKAASDSVSVADMPNLFLASHDEKKAAGEVSNRHFADCR